MTGIPQLGVSRFLRARSPTEPHIHKGLLEVGFCMRSSIYLENREGTFPVSPGWFFANKPNMSHRLSARPNGLYVYYFLVRRPTVSRPFLGMPPEESREIWKRLLRLPHTFPAGVRASSVRKLFISLFQFYDAKRSPWTAVQMRQAFLALTLAILETAEHPAETACLKRVERAAETIREHPELRFSLDDLSREAALSPTHFINQFRKVTGFPPIRFLIECRIHRAMELLANPAATAADVAAKCGFHSPQHFSDTFTRIVGVPPIRWRAEKNHTLG